MKPTKPGEWWWCRVDGILTVALACEKYRPEDGMLALGHDVPVGMDADDLRIEWLGPVAPFAASHDPAAPDASDEVRLAAGWEQQAQPVELSVNGRPGGREWMELAKSTPAPGPAGLWRLQRLGRVGSLGGGVVTADEAIALLDVKPAIEVAWTSKDGTKRDDDGNDVDPRQTVPWVWALGPFGSWPETLEGAIEDLRAAKSLEVADSWRCGRCVCFKPNWGYAARGGA